MYKFYIEVNKFYILCVSHMYITYGIHQIHQKHKKTDYTRYNYDDSLNTIYFRYIT